MLSNGPLGGLQIWKKKGKSSSVSMVTEQSRSTYSFSRFPRKSNPSENGQNWFEVSHSHLRGSAFTTTTTTKKQIMFLHNSCSETFVTVLMEGSWDGHSKSATYTMRAPRLALQLLSDTLIRWVCVVIVKRPVKGIKGLEIGKEEG